MALRALRIPFSPTLKTTAYASGNAMGIGGSSQVKNVFAAGGAGARLTSILATDIDKQSAHLALMFFRSVPSVIADAAAYAPTAADLLLLIGEVDLPAANYFAFSTNSAFYITPGQIGLDMRGVTRDIWVQLVSYGTPTYTVASNLKFYLTFEQDMGGAN